jgi:hypothetical protein
MGDYYYMMSKSNAVTKAEWANGIPNQGFIRYLDLLNQERVLLTDLDAIREILVKRADEFPKPPHYITLLGIVAGQGTLTSQGEVHQVRLFWHPCPPLNPMTSF